MKRIPKQDVTRKTELADALDKAYAALEDELSVFNEKLTQIWSPVAEAIQAYNAVVADVNGFKSDIANEIQSYMDERSEKWAESDAASSYQEWKGAWEEDIEEADIADPETVELPELATGDVLRDLENEVTV